MKSESRTGPREDVSGCRHAADLVGRPTHCLFSLGAAPVDSGSSMPSSTPSAVLFWASSVG